VADGVAQTLTGAFIKTAMDVWRRIVKDEPEAPAGLAAELGKVAEEPILVDWCQRHGLDRAEMERTVEVWLPDEPHFRGELDGLVRSMRVGLDAKLVLSPSVMKQWGQEGTDQVPDHILCQQAWYAMIADLDHIEIVAAIAGDGKDYRYNRTNDYEAWILEEMRKFWRDYVLAKRPPPVQTVDDALYLYPANKNEVRPATDAECKLVEAWRGLVASADKLDEDLKLAKARVCEAIGDSEGLWLGKNDRVTWKADRNGKRSLRG
jgi:predicted phage-related endonuclease